MVVLPASYDLEPAKRYPVIYLLHGAGGDHYSWVKSPQLRAFVRKHDVICVSPSGRRYGWYVDSPRVATSQLETFILRELVPHIDRAYRTRAARDARAIMGFSMGGHGALTLSARHPDVFCSASSIAGIMDLSRWPKNWNIAAVLGPRDGNEARWVNAGATAHAPLFAGAASGVRIMTDCGFDDFAYPENVEFHQVLGHLGVEHTFVERPGAHNWQYWTSVVAEHLAFHMASFERGGAH
jgi:S-formylglutathione hydrolase FrmB